MKSNAILKKNKIKSDKKKSFSAECKLDKIINLLDEVTSDELNAVLELKELHELKGKNIFSILLKNLTHLDFTEKKAKAHWQLIVWHKKKLQKSLKRDPGLRVSIFDYFSNIDKRFKNPKIIEMSKYTKTEQEALTDTLTGLYNYKFFRIVLKKEMELSIRTKLPVSLMLIDIDNFKLFNDSFGHLNGDMVLQTISKIMKDTLRTPDYLFRYGGEEFAIIFPNSNKNGALLPAERLREKIENHIYKNVLIPNNESITVSSGIASFPVDSDNEIDLIKKADQALYHAKYRGKNRVSLFTTNRRQFFRLDLVRKITFETLHPAKKRCIGKLINVSEGGVSFLVGDNLIIGTNIRISVPINEKYKFLDLVGRVVRVEKVKEKNKQFKFKVGLEFIKLQDNDKVRLKEIVESNGNSNVSLLK